MTPLTRSLSLGMAACLIGLFLLTTFVPYPPARIEAEAYFSAEVIDTGLQYTFERRCLFWAFTAADLMLLGALALTGWSRTLADLFLRWTGNRRILAALGMGLLYGLLREILYLPFGIARLAHARAWGMSNLDLPGWLHDHFLSVSIQLAGEALVFAGLYLVLIRFPRSWWWLAALGGSILGVMYALLAPLLLAPLFNDFTPLTKTPWHPLQARVQKLVDRAGIPVQEILVMNASRQSNHTNAYFAGFGSSRRIVLYDTLLKKHTDAEIESILAHEIGHWQHDHIVKGIVLATIAVCLGLYLLERLLRRLLGRAPWHLQSLADPAGAPLILLLMSLGSWACMPLENAISRFFERQADQASLDLAGQPDAFIAAEEKMACDNKSNVAPTPWNVWLFSSHPTTLERIRMAQQWKDNANLN